MSKKKIVVREVASSNYEIFVDDKTEIVNTFAEAERKFRNAVGREPISAYLYRNDFDAKGELIETYMLA
jgi:hypothetical protein